MNTGLSVRDRIKYLERMRDWFKTIYLIEDSDNPILWKRGEGYYAITTHSVVNTLNATIAKYKMGVSNSQLERDRDMLNGYIEFYNKNLNTTMDSLITKLESNL